MNVHDTGGPAFPQMDAYVDVNGERPVYVADGGMTLRDYFAAHSVQPGCGEIASIAGLTYRNGGVWQDENTRVGGFDDWFNALPLNERLSLFAKVKWAMADAMLAARGDA